MSRKEDEGIPIVQRSYDLCGANRNPKELNFTTENTEATERNPSHSTNRSIPSSRRPTLKLIQISRVVQARPPKHPPMQG